MSLGSGVIIDEDGYLLVSLEELCELTSASTEQAESALRLVQSFDPIGVAARDLRECLLLQLEARGLKDTLQMRQRLSSPVMLF